MLHQIRLPSLLTRTRVIALVVAALGLGACAETTTSVDQTWMAPTARAHAPLRKVVTMFFSPNVTMRHEGEDQLARSLAAKGIAATPGYAIFGEEDTTDFEAVKTKLRDLGYDGVVTMRIVDREQQLEYTPSTFDGYWGYWGADWGLSSGYAYTETTYRIETAAYSLRTGELVWSALTKSVDPDTAHELIHDTTKVIAGELNRNGLGG